MAGAAFTEVSAKLGLDTGPLQAGLNQSAGMMDRFATGANRSILRKFGGAGLMKGIMQGIGIGSTMQIAELLTKPLEEAAEAAKQIADASERTLQNYKQIFAARRTDRQNLEFLKREESRIAREMEGIANKKVQVITQQGQFGGTYQTFEKPKQTEDEAKQLARLGEEASRLQLEREQLQKKIRAEEKRDNDKRMEEIRKVFELSDDLRLASMSNEQKLATLQKKRADVLAEIAKTGSYTVEHEKLRLELEGSIRKVEEEILDVFKRQAEYRIAKEEEVSRQSRDLAREAMTTEEAIADVEEERLEIQAKINGTGFETVEQAKELLRLNKELSGLEKTRDENAKRARERRADDFKRLGEAEAARTEAQRYYATAVEDRTGATLADVAGGKTGNSKERARAREVQRLEARASRIRQGGGEFRDEQGNIVDRNRYAIGLTKRALGIRRNMGTLLSSERDPMKSASEAIIKSEEHLADIKEELASATVES